MFIEKITNNSNPDVNNSAGNFECKKFNQNARQTFNYSNKRRKKTEGTEKQEHLKILFQIYLLS